MAKVQRNDYVIDVDPTELDRLVNIARLMEGPVREGFGTTTIGPGSRVIDIGCGTLGALPVLADIVGPLGTVVGLDMDAQSLARGRAILDASGRSQVQLIEANINAMDPAALGLLGQFDAAFLRLFLFHQQDPAATLRRIAALVRPGGWIVAHEFLYVPQLPASVPPLPAIDFTWNTGQAVMQRAGASWDVARQFRQLCRAAGLMETRQRGFIPVGMDDTGLTLQVVHDTLVALRTPAISMGVATAPEIDAALAQLRSAVSQEFEVLFGSIFVELIAQRPASGTHG
jgi:ubiquinone/menaquinone biosynthesis C-methylase UbiE